MRKGTCKDRILQENLCGGNLVETLDDRKGDGRNANVPPKAK